MRKRLRPAYTPEQLARIYPHPHQHTRWPDHNVRVDQTIALARWFLSRTSTIADLSCGDACIAQTLGGNVIKWSPTPDQPDEFTPGPRLYLGDFASGYEYTGPIERTIYEIPPVDLFILSETLEHLDDPDAVLARVREKAKFLVLTTPDSEDNDLNPEHYWGWGRGDVYHMLDKAGWTPEISSLLEFRPYGGVYDFQMWGCS